jgi:hypothetical protein
MPPAAGQLPADVLERDAVYRRRDDAQLLLIRQRPEYAKVCWGAAVGATTARPPAIKLSVDFDATGREVARSARMPLPPNPGSVEERVIACVASDKPPRLTITPPGKPESIELSLSFP